METMSAAGDTVELLPSGNHTWFAGKSANGMIKQKSGIPS